jgi:hypothetical protein
MNSSKSRSPAQECAIHSHRDALEAAKKAVEEWAAKDEGLDVIAAKNEGLRDVIASAILEHLGECATDTDGDDTLEIVSDLFEDHWKRMSNHLAHTLGQLAQTAHALGHAHTQPQ